MRKATHNARTGALPAIAAALALSSTQALAQEAPAQPQPATTEPPPAVSATPAPALDSAPVTPDSLPAPDVAPTPKSTPAAKKTITAAKTAAKPAIAVTNHKAARTATRTVHAAVPAAAAPATAAARSARPPTAGSAIRPVVDTSARPARPSTAPAATPANRSGETALEIGGGALALLAIGAAAYGLSRRRRREGEAIYEETYEPETVAASESEATPQHDPIFDEQPAVVAPEASAFAWGNRAPAEQAGDDGSDRRPGETWVERAYRGPSPANPSVSLKNRLRRAAFFDKREREVAEGKAEPVEADAGLPERELA